MSSPSLGSIPVSSRNAIVIVLLVAAYFIITALPAPAGLTPGGIKAMLFMVSAVVIWALEILPIALGSALFVMLPVLTGMIKMPQAMSLFATPVIFFAFSMFCVAIAFQNSGLSQRLVLWASLRSQGSPRRLLLYLMCCCAAMSTVVADLPVVAMMLPVAIALLDNNGCKAGSSNFGKAVMLGIPFAAYIGGIGTPAGAAPNMMTIAFLESTVGLKISFFEWAAIGLPMVVLLTPIAYWILTMVYPFEVSSLVGMDKLEQEYKALGGIKPKEAKFLIVLVINLTLWCTDKLHGLPLPLVAVCGATLYALPHVELLNWKTDKNKVGWDSLMLIGAANLLGMLVWQNEAAAWIAQTCLAGVADMSIAMAIAIIALFTVLVHLIIPVNTAIVAIMLPTLAALASTMQVNPVAFAIPMGFSVSAAFLLPLDVVSLVTFSAGYYRIIDMAKPGIVLSAFWVVVMTLVMMIIASPILGLF